MFFSMPKAHSQVPGITIETDIIPDNIAVDEHAHQLVDEYLKITVTHDGSNPFCAADECFWGFIFAMSVNETEGKLLTEESPITFQCLPRNVQVTEIIVCEQAVEGSFGIWCVFETSDVEYGIACKLISYPLPN